MRPGVKLVAGRWLKKGDRQKVMVVSWLAKRRTGLKDQSYEIGGTIQVRHVPYEVIGHYEAPDIAIIPAGIVPLEDLRKGLENPGVAQAKRFLQKRKTDDGLAGLAMEQLTKVIEKLLSEQEERFYPHEVIPENPSQLPAIGKELKEKLPHVAVIEPEKLAEAMEKAVAIFLAITAVVSVISSIVGGLLIVNTMAMAVVERRREVSIKVAIGASTGQVALEFVLEAAIMGFAGALIGTAFGCAAIEILNPWILNKVEIGASFFKITPSLIAGVIVYGVGLGVIAGFVPALRAVRTDPAQGLREL
jgi:ABC-type antimicrobial peptide transport system permease subunit